MNLTQQAFFALCNYIGNLLALVAMGVFFEIVGYIIAIVAGLLSIALRIPRIKSDIRKYHNNSWVDWLRSFLKK